jgi:predicted NAD/FAD-binding protein
MNATASASPSSAPASPGWPAPGCWRSAPGHAVRGAPAPRRPHQHGRRHAGRQNASGRHRLPGLQRQDLPEPDRLFDHLGVDSVESEMSFAVSLEPRIEWAGSSLATCSGRSATCCARRSGACSPTSCASTARAPPGSLRHPTIRHQPARLPREGGYSRAFADWYLLPMAAAIWSCPTGQMLDMPLATFVRFCHNHGLLQVFDRPLWRTVSAAAASTSNKLAAAARRHPPRHAGAAP